jgi:hypothetical protein
LTHHALFAGLNDQKTDAAIRNEEPPLSPFYLHDKDKAERKRGGFKQKTTEER